MKNKVFTSELCSMLDIKYPIVLAGMATLPGLGTAAAGPDLAAAISNAGGLGVVGCGTMTPDQIYESIKKVRSLTDKPFGVDLLLPSSAPESGTVADLEKQLPPEKVTFVNELKVKLGIPEPKIEEEPYWRLLTGESARKQLDVILEERVPVFVSGLGNPAWMVPEAHDRGIKVLAIVGNTKNARRVAEGGVDIVVATGSEAGGHSSRVGTLALIPQVVDSVKPVPVIAGGGIVSGRQLAAALILGACGVWCGTVFLATHEASIDMWWKEKIIAATDEGTVQSKYFTGKLNRHFKNPWDIAWEEAGVKPLNMPLQGVLVWSAMLGAKQAGLYDYLGARAGQGAGLIKEIKSAKQVVDDMIDEARQALEDLPGRLKLNR